MLLSCGKKRKRKPTPHPTPPLLPHFITTNTLRPDTSRAGHLCRVFSLCWNVLSFSSWRPPTIFQTPTHAALLRSLLCYLNLHAIPQAPSSHVYQVTRWDRIKGNVCLFERRRKGSQKITPLTDNYRNRGLWRTLPAAAADTWIQGELWLEQTQQTWGAPWLCNLWTLTCVHKWRSVNYFQHFKKSKGRHIFARGKYVQASALGLSRPYANSVWYHQGAHDHEEV